MAELDVETELSRIEAANFLREIADELEGAGVTPDIGAAVETGREAETMTVVVGDESATVVLPERLVMEVEIGSRSGILESGVDQHIELDLSWTVEETPEDESIEVK
jgi:hypothetical protein